MANTFGVELETNIPHSKYNYNLRGVNFGLPDGWKIKGDSSVNANAGYYAFEFVSPVLTGLSGMESVKCATASMMLNGVKVNASCGLHVHIGAVDFTRENVAQMKNLARIYEFAIYGLSGAKIERRLIGQHGLTYCKSSQHWTQRYYGYGDRYHSLNITNWSEGDTERPKNTLEFRAFAGTIDTLDVLSAVTLCRAMGNLVKRYSAGELPAMDTPRIVSPVKAMQEFINNYLSPSASRYSGILLTSDVKARMTQLAAAAEKKLLSL